MGTSSDQEYTKSKEGNTDKSWRNLFANSRNFYFTETINKN